MMPAQHQEARKNRGKERKKTEEKRLVQDEPGELRFSVAVQYREPL